MKFLNIFVLALVLLVAACGGDAADTPATGGEVSTPAEAEEGEGMDHDTTGMEHDADTTEMEMSMESEEAHKGDNEVLLQE